MFKVRLSERWIQYAATLSASLSMFIAGMHFVWTSPSLPRLYANDSIIPTTIEQGSWIAAVELIADLPGAPLGAIAADIVGRKSAILLTAIPYLFSWLLIYSATDFYMIVAAKLLVGLADGSIYTILPMYIGEISDDDIRGKLGNFMALMLDIGSLFLYAVGPWISIQSMAIIGAVFPVLLIITFCHMPESPYYYLMQDEQKLAKAALKKLHGSKHIDLMFQDMSKVVQKQMTEESSWTDLYKNTIYFKSVLILIGIKTMQQFCGIYVVMIFTELIFEQAGGVLPASITTIIFGVVQLISGFVSMFTIDRVGRRPLLITSCIGCFVPLSIQAIYFYIQFNKTHNLEFVEWIPLTCMLSYIVMYSIGLGAIPLVLSSEMLPTNIKAKASCVVDIYFSMIGFLVVYLYQSIADTYGSHIPFGFFAICTILGVFFVLFCVPETKGHSLDQIQLMLTSPGKMMVKKRCIM